LSAAFAFGGGKVFGFAARETAEGAGVFVFRGCDGHGNKRIMTAIGCRARLNFDDLWEVAFYVGEETAEGGGPELVALEGAPLINQAGVSVEVLFVFDLFFDCVGEVIEDEAEFTRFILRHAFRSIVAI
jgi:hypothetical protein